MFDNLKRLENLHLHFNCLKSPLQPGVFHHLNHLIRLDLSHNQLEFICVESLQPLNNLKNLFLGHNQIKSLDENSFVHMDKLVELSLQHNQIEREEDAQQQQREQQR